MSAATLEAGERSYRPDIDGLRAVAVLVIIAFHGWPAAVTGGFVGVDVFFVISGFLITRIIAGERDEGRFSFARFYLRRARRILPAYVLVTLAIAIAAFVILLPYKLVSTGYALAASGLFLTNVYFSLDNNYFLPAAHDNLLLHLWSLAVEEQFYLLWPLILVLLSKGGPAVRAIGLGLLALASLGLAQWLLASNQSSFAFFLLPSRAWELLLGAGLALGLAGAPTRRAAAEAAVAAGLVMIAVAVFAFSERTPFPGLSALLPCLGAALVIWGGGGPRTAAAAVLRSPAMVGVGLISYSLYLWHWPVLTLPRLLAQRPLEHLETVGLIALSFGLAALTWRFVERPWRRPLPQPRLRHLGLAAAALAVFVGAGAAAIATGGFPGRLSPEALARMDGVEDMNPLQEACFVPREQFRRPDLARCTEGGAPGRPANSYDVLVWGDSHGDAYAPGIVEWAKGRGLRIRQLHKGACPILVDVKVRAWRGEDPSCLDFNRWVLEEIRAHPETKLIVISARWPVYINARPRYHLFPSGYEMRDARTGRRLDRMDTALAHTLDAIAATGSKAQVLVIGAIPDLPYVVPFCLAQAAHLRTSDAHCRALPSKIPLQRVASSEAQIKAAIQGRPFAEALYPARHLCGGGTCRTVDGEMLLYFDHNHISATAARKLVPGWMDEALGLPGAD